jgi:hypothetical protein
MRISIQAGISDAFPGAEVIAEAVFVDRLVTVSLSDVGPVVKVLFDGALYTEAMKFNMEQDIVG